MDTKQYISSGILELYVLGKLSEQEIREVEVTADAYPAVREEITNIEESLELLALSAAPEVPSRVLEQTLAKINLSPAETSNGSSGTTGQWLVMLLAVAALAATAWLWYTNQQTNNKLANLQSAYEQLEADCSAAENKRQEENQILASLSDPATKNVVLNCVTNNPIKKAIVFYNEDEGITYFSATRLPEPPAGKQYQLWGIDADGPKSLGVLDLNLTGDVVIPIDYLPNVLTFAITLEDLGGKPEPDLESLEVIGKVKVEG